MVFDNRELKLPDDLAEMSEDELRTLCERIRKRLIDVVSKNGGHLASNLGVVELTVALCSFYNPYKDRIVWDVGHQAYVHKILTGRDSAMDTLRQNGGISGFPKREESEADAFDTGHSSTSISAALGMARAAQLCGSDVKTVAVIGDGALTGGMAFEALNDAAQSKCDITVVLNDNGMSISKNVGALSKYLRRVRTQHSYITAKKKIRRAVVKIPLVGEKLARRIRKMKNSIKFRVVAGGEFFENLGLTYIGPVDGHDILALRTAFERAERSKETALIHVITKKGKGYRYAEENPGAFHGITPFDIETGSALIGTGTPAVSLSKVFSQKLCELAEKDDKICAVTAAMPTGTYLKLFNDRFPSRFFDVGIAEQHAVTMCAGMSAMGMKPVAVIYSTFMQRAYDQLLHDVSVQGLPLVAGFDRAGVAGPDGETHQGIYDFAYLGHLPGATVAAPANAEELEQMLELGISMYGEDSEIPKGLFAIRYPAKERWNGSGNVSEVVYGKGCVCYDSRSDKSGKADLCIMSVGEMLGYAVNAAESLTRQYCSVIVYNARFFKPLDADGVQWCAENSRMIITVEDAVIVGGFGEHVKLMLSRFGYTAVEIAALPDEIVRHGTIGEIHNKYGLDAAGIEARFKYFSRTGRFTGEGSAECKAERAESKGYET